MTLKKTTARLLSLTLMAGVLAMPAQGASKKKDDDKQGVPKVFAPLMGQPNVRFIESFKSVSGVVGYAFQVGLEARVYYVLPDGKTMINGELIAENGDSISNTDEKRYLDQVDFGGFWASAPPLPDALQPLASHALAAATSANLGSSEPKVFMLYDGFCGYCRLSWTKLRPLKDSPIAAIPVSRMNQRSSNLAAALIEASDKRFTMDLLETDEGREVLLQRFPVVSPETLTKIAGNNALMDQLGIQGTPTWIWKGADGKVRTHSGVVPEKAMASIPSNIGSTYKPVAVATEIESPAVAAAVGAGGAMASALVDAAIAANPKAKVTADEDVIEVLAEPVQEPEEKSKSEATKKDAAEPK